MRALVARQDRAWSAGDLDGYFATFTADAVFVDQAQNPRGGVLPYGRSTLPQARAQARKFFARSRVRQESVVQRIELAPDRRSARVQSRHASVVEAGGQTRHACGLVDQTVTLDHGRLLSRGQTETAIRCR